MKTMITLVILVFLSFSTGLSAETLEDRLKTLEETIKKQEQALSELRKMFEELKAGINRPSPLLPLLVPRRIRPWHPCRCSSKYRS